MNRERVKRFLKLATFAVTLTTILMVGGGPIAIAYIYMDAQVNRDCGDTYPPMPERIGNPPDIEAISFQTENNITLNGWYLPGTNGAGIIALPGAWGNANTMDEEMRFLHEAGYSVMTYETRICGNPPSQTSLGYTEKADLKIALDLMSQRPEVDPNRIGVFGHSMGGATAIMVAAEDKRIKALVATGNYGDLALDIRGGEHESLISRWTRSWIMRFYEWETGVEIEKVSPLNVIGEISPRAVLLMHGSEEIAESMGMEQFEAAHEPKELWIVPGAGHGGYLETAPDEYVSRTLQFFETYLGE